MTPASGGRGFWMARSMARIAGVALTGALADGRLTRRDLSDLVGACEACPDKDACLDWLAQSCGGPSCPPDFCRIGPALAGL